MIIPGPEWQDAVLILICIKTQKIKNVKNRILKELIAVI